MNFFFNDCHSAEEVYIDLNPEFWWGNQIWWDDQKKTDSEKLSGGILWMRRGHVVQDTDIIYRFELIFAHIMQFCAVLHASGRVHRDIRWPNILKIEIDKRITYQLIDYGFSGEIGSKFNRSIPDGIR